MDFAGKEGHRVSALSSGGEHGWLCAPEVLFFSK